MATVTLFTESDMSNFIDTLTITVGTLPTEMRVAEASQSVVSYGTFKPNGVGGVATLALFDTNDTSVSPNFMISNFSKSIPADGVLDLLTLYLNGDDVITGSIGADTLRGFNGTDTLIGGEGGDSLMGDAGNDTASYANAKSGVAAIMQDVGFNSGEASGDTYTSIENLIGSAFKDTLYGTTNIANILDGGAGNDVLVGRGGADKFIGGIGIDTVSYDSSAGVRADFLNPVANTGNAALNTYSSIENLDGSSFADVLLGDNTANVIRGSSFPASVSGRDQLFGRGGNDNLNGFDDNDLLSGGAGNDTLTGAAGNDIFVFREALLSVNRDRITDYNVVQDTIHLDNAVFAKLVGPANTTLSSVQFFKGAAAHDLNDRIIYNPTTGALLYDADGNKAGGVAAIAFATVSTGLAMTNADFVII